MALIDPAAFGFCGPTYNFQLQSPLVDNQRALNLYPDINNPHSKGQVALVGTPGLTLFGTMPTEPIRALWAGDNRLFCVAGTHVYEVSSSGGVTTDFGAIPGSSGGYYPCTFTYDGTHLLLYDPTVASAGGGLSGAIFNVNPSGPSVDQVGNNGAGNVCGGALTYLDSYCIALDSSTNNRVNVSASLDGTTWDAANYVVRSGASDLVTWLETLNGQLWIFGQKTIEVWYNAGNPSFPFARVPGATLNLGLLAPWTVVKFQNCLMWLGCDSLGYGTVYQTQGLSAKRVSNQAVELYISQMLTYGAANSLAFGYEEDGHAFFVLKLIQTNGGSALTFVYDLATGMWHERAYCTSFPNEMGYLPQCAATVPFFSAPPYFNFVGDYSSGAIYKMALPFTSDAGTKILRIRTAPHVSDSNRWTKYGSLELDADIGTAAVTLTYSNDGGATYLSLARPDATITGSTDDGGPTGGPTAPRFIWRQLGRSRDRVFRTLIYDKDNRITINSAFLYGNPGLRAARNT